MFHQGQPGLAAGRRCQGLIARLQLLCHRPLGVLGVSQNGNGLPCGSHPPQQIPLLLQKLRRAEKRGLGLPAVQHIQQRRRVLSGGEAEIDPLALHLHAGGGLRHDGPALPLLLLEIFRIAAGNGKGGGVNEYLVRQSEARLPQPGQISPDLLPVIGELDIRHRVLQAEELGHHRGGHIHLSAPLDAAGIITGAVGVIGIVLALFKAQSSPAADAVQDHLIAAGHPADVQGLPGRAGKGGAGNI